MVDILHFVSMLTGVSAGGEKKTSTLCEHVHFNSDTQLCMYAHKVIMAALN